MRRLELAAVLAGVLALGAGPSALAADAVKGASLRAQAPASLADLEAIRAWAKSTSWGGAEVDAFKSDGREVIVVRRSFTSGIESCGLTVFIPTKLGWTPGLSVDVANFWLNVSQNGDAILIANSSSKAEVARFSIAQLQANPKGTFYAA